jgi:hypothetical protein
MAIIVFVIGAYLIVKGLDKEGSDRTFLICLGIIIAVIANTYI